MTTHAQARKKYQPPGEPNADSNIRARLMVPHDPRYLALKQKLAEKRAEARELRRDLKYQTRRAELWRQRALKAKR